MAADIQKNDGITFDADTIRYGSHTNAAKMLLMDNKSGGDLVTADVVVADGVTERGVVPSTTLADLRKALVVPQEVRNGDVPSTATRTSEQDMWAYFHGRAPAAHIVGTVAIYEYLRISTTTKKFIGTGVIMGATTTPPQGTQAIALAAGADTDIPVYLLPFPITKPMDNLAATTNPTINDDIADGYTVGSMWWNTTLNIMFRCINNAIGAARWVFQSPWVAPYAAQNTSNAEVQAALFTIPKKSMGASGLARLHFSFEGRNNSGGVVIFTMRTYWNGALELTNGWSLANVAVTTRETYGVLVAIRNRNNVALQTGASKTIDDTTGNTEGLGTGPGVSGGGWFESAADTDAADTELKVTMQMATSHANTEWRLIDGRVTVDYVP